MNHSETISHDPTIVQKIDILHVLKAYSDASDAFIASQLQNETII